MSELLDLLQNKIGWPTKKEIETVAKDVPAVEFNDENLLKKCPLALLSRYLVPTADYSPSSSYTFTVLLNSRVLVPPHELLADVCTRCALNQNETATIGLIKLLAEWTDIFPYDFIDEKAQQQLKSALGRIVTLYPSLCSDISILTRTLQAKKAAWKKYESLLGKIQEESDIKRDSNTYVDITELCPSTNMMAKQLTHIELERLSMIGPDELMRALLGKDSEKNRPKNLESYIFWFNRLSSMAASCVCTRPKRRDRVKMLDYWMDVAKECMQLANFNSFMAIVSGLNTPPVSRLKKTWSKAHSDKFSALEKHLSPMSNFSIYRSSLKAALWRASHAPAPVVVPFFSVFVKDAIVLADAGLGGSSVPWERWWAVSQQVAQLVQWKSVECPYDRHPTVLNYLLTNPVLIEKQLDVASYECEQPENSSEKEAFKKLKEALRSTKSREVNIKS